MREGISRPSHHRPAVYTETDLRVSEMAKDPGLDELKEGIHVVEYWAYNQVIYELDKAKADRDKALAERDRWHEKYHDLMLKYEQGK